MLIRSAFLQAVLLATCSCLSGGVLPGTKALPTASATLHWATIDLPRGSYCWQSAGHGECADSASSDQLLKSAYLKPYRTAGGFDVKITFRSATQPNSFNVQVIQSPDGKLGTVLESAPHTFSIGMSPPATAGLYVYLVTGTWPEGDVGFFLTIDLIPGAA